MFFTDDASDSGSDDLAISYLKQGNFTPRSQIADKYRCLVLNFKYSAVVEFLETLLTYT